MSTPKRILAVDDDTFFLQVLREQLSRAGHEVAVEREPTRVVARAQEFAPHLILMDRTMPLLSGGEVTRALRAFTLTASVPIAFLTAETSELEALRALRSGAVDVMHKPFGPEHVRRVTALLEELAGRAPRPNATAHQALVQNLLAYFRRCATTRALLLNPGTPFEGRAVFEAGELVAAEYGPVKGLEALEEMLWIEDGVWRLEGAQAAADLPPIELSLDDAELVYEPLPPAKPRLLFVDDETDLCRLFKIHFTRAGFETVTAEDGEEGYRLATASPFDVVVADLNMPRLDGWGLLRLLKSDHRTREVPVFFLSAHDDYRETLKAAHAGAHDYLPKTGRADGVVARAMALVAPRVAARKNLQGGNRRAVLDVSLLGPQWIVRTLNALRLTGRFEARDEWGRYVLAFRDGELSLATAATAGRDVSGVPALAALLVSRGAQGTFGRGPVAVDRGFGFTLEAAIARACETLNGLEGRVTSNRLAQAGAVTVDAELYQLFLRIASDRDLLLARAVCETKVKLAELPSRLSMSPEDVQTGLKELVRRRVISVE
ncbi:MAG: response regulator [Myxococcaceae bacterium]